MTEGEKIQNRVERRVKKRFHIQFSKIAVVLLLMNVAYIEYEAIQLMRSIGDLSSLYALLAIAGTDCLGGVIWYMKNSAKEKEAFTQLEIEKERIKMGKKFGVSVDTTVSSNGSGEDINSSVSTTTNEVG